MEKSIESINKTFKTLKFKDYDPFLKELLKFIHEEDSKPEEEVDSDFILYCVRIYCTVAGKQKTMKEALSKHKEQLKE